MADSEKKSKRLFNRIGLAGRLSTMVSIIAVFIYIPVILFNAYENMTRSKVDMDHYQRSLELRIQSVFEPPAWNYDIETLKELITTELQNRKLRSIHISSAENSIIWLESRNGSILPATEAPTGPYIEMHIVPIYKMKDYNQIIAYATIWYDHSESRSQFYSNLVNEILRSGVIILILAAALTISSYVMLVKPLEAIRNSMIEAGRSSHDLARKHIEEASFKKAFPEIRSMAEDLEHMFRDIDAAQSQTLANEALLKAIFQQAGVGVALVCADEGRYVIVNQRFCDIVGYSMEEMLNMPFEKITHPCDFPYQQEKTKELLDGKIPELSLQKRYIRKDGQVVWAELTVSPLLAPHERPARQIAVIQDITARKKAEAEIKKLNDELEAKVVARTKELESANNKLESALKDLKEAQSHLVNQEKMAVLGQLVSGIAHELNTPLGIITSAGGTLDRIMRQDMQKVIAFCASAPPRAIAVYNQLVGIGVEKSDTIDLREKRQNRKRYSRVLQEKCLNVPDEVLEKLTDLGYSEDEDSFAGIFQDESSQEAVRMAYSTVTMHKSTHMIRISAEKASKVISALKTYSHREADQKLVPCDVAKDIEVVLTLYYNQTKFGVEIEKQYQEVPPVLCYPDKLHQVWVNIINNALQAMNYKGKLKIGIATVEDKVKVTITDNGPGIPESIKDRIFEPFFTTKKSGEGTGLGLDIAKRIIGEIGGSIDVESTPGETTFTVWLRT